MATAKQTARAVKRDPTLRAFARAGYVATGVVHILIGVIVLAVAVGGEGDADQSGAFRAIAAVPAGFVALWALAVALVALALWHAVAAVGARGDSGQRWRTRLTEAGQAAAFAAIGVIAVVIAVGGRPDGERNIEQTSSGVLAVPGGAFLLGAVGVGVAVGGIAFMVMGVRRSFRDKLTVPRGAAGTAIVTLGVIGYIAKGAALLTVGVLLTIAAVTVDPSQAGGLDGAVRALLLLPAGPALTIGVGSGLIAYGVFCVFRARFARL